MSPYTQAVAPSWGHSQVLGNQCQFQCTTSEVSVIPADCSWKARIYIVATNIFFMKQNLHVFQLQLKQIQINSVTQRLQSKKGDCSS